MGLAGMRPGAGRGRWPNFGRSAHRTEIHGMTGPLLGWIVFHARVVDMPACRTLTVGVSLGELPRAAHGQWGPPPLPSFEPGSAFAEYICRRQRRDPRAADTL